MTLVHHFFHSLIDWLFRRRSPALVTMRIGLTCIALVFGGWAFDISVPVGDGRVAVGFVSSDGSPSLLSIAAAITGFFLVLTALIWELARYRTEQRHLARKKVIVIEARGLRDGSGTPLIDAIPSKIEGRRDDFLVDLRQHVKDGEIVVPAVALNTLVSLPNDLRRRQNGLDRRDITLVYGGMTPVPFTFLTGVLIDDEETIVVLDWHRHSEAWHQLDSADDGNRFHVSQIDQIPEGAREVGLIVSVSYSINVSDVRTKLGDLPIVELKLEDGSPDCHWSGAKQRALGQQFLTEVVRLGDRGIHRIHLFLAAQNSVAFRFGRLYDKRNLPEVVVYQYQRGATPPYPWGILMPVSGVQMPEILMSTAVATCASL